VRVTGTRIELVDVGLHTRAFRVLFATQMFHAERESATGARELRATGAEARAAFFVRAGNGFDLDVESVLVGRDGQPLEEGVAHWACCVRAP